MTVEELKEAIEPRLTRIERSIAAVEPALAGIQATLAVSLERHANEISVLFDARSDHERRIAGVERDYTPRSEHTELTRRVSSLEQTQWKTAGVMAAIQFLGIAGIAALVKWGGG